MNKTACALALLAGFSVQAAPLDAFLTASHPALPGKPEIELGYDLANRSVDVLGLRPKPVGDSPAAPGGDYSGGHLSLGIRLSADLWLDAALWRRQLSYVSVSTDVTTWQVAAQYQVLSGADDGPALALRAGAWGNSAPQMRKRTPVDLMGTTFTSVTATRPRDTQLQFDLVATWPLGRGLQLSGHLGGGVGRVDFDKVSATTRAKDGCPFDVEFTDTRVVATCEQDGTSMRISVPNAVYGVDPSQEARYTSTFAGAGIAASWRGAGWRVRGGLQYARIDRGRVDEIVGERGGTAYKSNTVYLAEVGNEIAPRTLVFVRAQVTAHQFVGESPLTYNTLTASQQRRPYGVLSLGLAYAFD